MCYEGQRAEGQMKGEGHITNLAIYDSKGRCHGCYNGKTVDGIPHGQTWQEFLRIWNLFWPLAVQGVISAILMPCIHRCTLRMSMHCLMIRD
mmetsp:Transcript_4987/g.11647  ORF Transcript_4987/g.11647 Transcript_4987/m.11647 type:complete len:92 (+) Transcript_4987:741-1016(+)